MTRDGYGMAYRRGFDLTVRFLVCRGVHYDSADEVAQAAWVRGWERLAQLRNESLVVTWVNAIALNVYRSLARGERIKQLVADQLDERSSIDFAAIDIGRVLSRCRPGDRDLLEQHLNGVTTAEIAREKGVTETAIRIRLLRARRDVRSRMEPKKFALPQRGNMYAAAKQNAA